MNPLKLLKYAKFFSSDKFMHFANGVGKNVVFLRRACILFYCFRDPDTPKYVKAVIAGALGYLVLPIDVISDRIPFAGWIDDAAVIALAFKVANRFIKPMHRDQAQKLIPFGSED
ncbi:YkvA family protein [uncultured Veillonella sp.]|uniref:YkvA family protein n=1 Tax=uncultured Veillonella sp. TaxID=159268 RepID=UPI002639626C|nr:YkvA family protein [uncultured Veillonella sp.]